MSPIAGGGRVEPVVDCSNNIYTSANFLQSQTLYISLSQSEDYI